MEDPIKIIGISGDACAGETAPVGTDDDQSLENLQVTSERGAPEAPVYSQPQVDTEPVVETGMETNIITVTDLTFDQRVFVRDKIDQNCVKRYVDAMNNAVNLPPITVYVIDGLNIVVDGCHRVEAVKVSNMDTIECEIFYGKTWLEAVTAAAGANTGHGLPMSTKDKQKAVRRILEMPECQDFSDSRIASIVKISPPTVKKIRQKMVKEGSIAEISTRRVGKDGRVIETKNLKNKAKKRLDECGGLEQSDRNEEEEISRIFEYMGCAVMASVNEDGSADTSNDMNAIEIGSTIASPVWREDDLICTENTILKLKQQLLKIKENIRLNVAEAKALKVKIKTLEARSDNGQGFLK